MGHLFCVFPNVVVEQLGGLVHLGVEAPVPDLPHVGVVRARHKLLQVRKPTTNTVRNIYKGRKVKKRPILTTLLQKISIIKRYTYLEVLAYAKISSDST